MKHLYTALVIILSGLIVLFYFLSRSPAQPDVPVSIPHIGAVQILNGCGVKGVAQKIGDILRRKGFDVKEIGNAPDWNYEKTIVAARTRDMSVAGMVAEALRTENIIQLYNKSKMFDVTVFVGRDYLTLMQASH